MQLTSGSEERKNRSEKGNRPMNRRRRITASMTTALLLFGIWSSVTHSQDERVRRLRDDPPARKNLPRLPDSAPSPTNAIPVEPIPVEPIRVEPGATPTPIPLPDAGAAPMTMRTAKRSEETLVRDVDAKLLRYQSAAFDESAARDGKD